MILPVVFSSDHNFIMPTGVAIFSMLEANTESTFDIFILQSADVTDEDRKCLSDMVRAFSSKITFLNPGNYFSKSFEIRGISNACYFRLLIPWLIPQYDRVIYLDGDIVVKSDLRPLINLSAKEEKLVYGVRTPGFTLDSEYGQHINSLGLDNHKYINSGILVYNSKLIRKLNLKDRILSYTDKQFLFQDQDIINIVCKGNIGWLPLKYNSAPSLCNVAPEKLLEANITTAEEFEEALISPAIIHYAGPKPWKTFTYHWYDWWTAYSRSPFYDIEFATAMTKNTMHPQYTVKQLLKKLLKKLF